MTRTALLILALLLAGCVSDPFGYKAAREPQQAVPTVIVSGSSMEPTLKDGQGLFVSPIAFNRVRRNMIVVWQPDPANPTLNIKRVGTKNRLLPDNPNERTAHNMQLTAHNLRGVIDFYPSEYGVYLWDSAKGDYILHEPCRAAADLHRELAEQHGQNWRDWPETDRARLKTAIQKCQESRQ